MDHVLVDGGQFVREEFIQFVDDFFVAFHGSLLFVIESTIARLIIFQISILA
jgi:hypothetical protein